MSSGKPYNTPDDLLLDFRSGNQLALKAIFSIYYQPLWSYASRILKDELAADDIVAETFIKVWNCRAKMNSIKGLASYMYTVTKNDCIAYLKSQKRMNRVYQDSALISGIDTASDTLEAERMRAEIIQIILLETSSMPAQMKQVFQLVFLEGLTAPAIAAQLSVSHHTVNTQKKRAIHRIRKLLLKKGILDRWSFLMLVVVLKLFFILAKL